MFQLGELGNGLGKGADAGLPRAPHLQVISGQFLSERSVRTYVEVELFGLPGDTKRRYRTKPSPTTNSINPVWKEEPFVFEKILMPELASLRVAVMEEGNKFLGHRIIPINALNSGYHHLCLHSESNMPLTMPALFVFLEMKDYVPDTWADLTVALANPIKFFNAHDKKSVKLKEAMRGLPENPFPLGSPVARHVNEASAPTSNGSAAAGSKAKEGTTKEAAEPQTASLEELRKLKGVVKLQRRHEKELRELERRGTRRWEELLQRGAAQLHGSGAAGRGPEGNGHARARAEGQAGAGAAAAGRGQCECILKRKEQHVVEQMTKMMELAREKQAAELKTLKETLEIDTKEVKKRLEAKRLERIQAMIKVTTDKMAQERLKREINNSHIQEVVQVIKQNLERHQEKLEEKQAACLEQIREMEKQFQQEALAEYEARMKGLEVDVKELVKASLRACFPSAEEGKPERPCGVSRELCEQDALTKKADAQESRL
ncbi:1-phosphatidylinositol 4; 5-bisphosphate phosphodiesterase beta-2 [Camelus dromedarius]|uniref:1-phosphatidylinositol 4 n=1 Tax=Camelus dromedarius TaxID=9838 RepID=A0A5N4E3M2_CAMDR|nr:1-phosphatidylinositol 4; 5-bisphosphate phosphodiesterase beta-2 [Camelus dromedarius]